MPLPDEDRVDEVRDNGWIVPTGMVMTADRAVAGTGMIEEGYLVPLSSGQGGGASYLLVGLSPALPFDAAYRRFLQQVAGYLQVARTRVEEAERRAAAEREEKRLLAQRETLLAELEVANRAKDEFLAMLGHELRNPLSPIVTALRLMRRRREPHVPREQEIIERQVDHLMRLVDDLLDVARIARGKVELRREVVDVADVVDQGGGDRGRPAGEAAPPLGDRVRAGALLVQRRSGSAIAGRRQPAHERRQIHRPWGARSPWPCRPLTTR